MFASFLNVKGIDVEIFLPIPNYPEHIKKQRKKFRKIKGIRSCKIPGRAQRASAASERSDGTTEATRNNTKPQETHKKQTRFPFLT